MTRVVTTVADFFDNSTLDLALYSAPGWTEIYGIASYIVISACLDLSPSSANVMALARTNERPRRGHSAMASCNTATCACRRVPPNADVFVNTYTMAYRYDSSTGKIVSCSVENVLASTVSPWSSLLRAG